MKNRQIRFGIVLSYVYVSVNIISGIFFTPFLIKSLGQSQYGLYEIIASLASNLSLFNFGMGDSVVKYVALYKAEGNVEKQGEVVGIVLETLSMMAVFSGMICAILYWNFDSIYIASLTIGERVQGKRMFILAAINLVISLPGGMFSNVLAAYEKFGLIRFAGILKTFGRMVLIIIFLSFSSSATVILIIDTVLNIGLIILDMVLVRNWIKVPVVWKVKDRSIYNDIFFFSVYTIFFMIVKEVQFQTDKTIIGMRMSTLWVTVYTAGSKMSATFNQLGYVLSGMYMPQVISISREYKGGDLEAKYREYMISMGRILLPMISAILIGFIGLGNAFMTLWIGEGYELAYVSASIMMIALFLPIIEDTGLAILKVIGKQGTIAIAWFVSSLLNMVLTWFVVPYMGIVGASIMTLFTSYFVNMVALNVILKKAIGLKIRKFFNGIFKGTLPVMTGSVLFFIVCKALNISVTSWKIFIIQGVLFVVSYAALIYNFYLDGIQRSIIKNKVYRVFDRGNV